MKIAHVLHPFIPKMGYQENYLPYKQRELGHDVRIFTSTVQPKRRGKCSYDSGQGWHTYKGVGTYRHRPWMKFEITDEVLLKKLLTRLSEFNPDIIHSHGTLAPHLIQVYLYCVYSDTHLVVDDHTDEENFSLNTVRKRLLFSAYRYGVFPFIKQKIDKFLPIQEYAKHFLVSEMDVPEQDITLLPLGVDVTEFYSDERKGEEKRDELAINPSELVLLTVGHLEPDKRIEVVIRAVRDLIKEGSEIKLLVVGPGQEDYLDKLQSLVQTSGISDSVSFYGFADRNDLLHLYNAADIGIWPGISTAINEGIGTGLPIIIGKHRSTRHLADHGNGFVFDWESDKDLKAKIERYLETPELLDQHKEAALDFVAKHHSWQSIAEQSIEIYSSVLNKGQQ